jgi:hypothetical protein
MRWTGHIACVWRGGMHSGFWWENQKERHQQEDLLGRRIILKEIIENRME